MFGLIRLPILLLIAFVAGIFYERAQQEDSCAAMGGNWMRAGLCALP
ncbi:hypothetical protein [Sagittula stellata]|uniref:Uncharacterized protein n=1 Tax=Sagittula stellata (strain ATCC 700073 / DSM 11524 / E-37) TaxID=388399 RepID=A3KA81_SAGS3|nr:hypothetical protein [Sagittula stellata]EBA05872.1 hypothetical protein SSE37_15648 [Sagittula stellata E-37]